MTQRGEAIVNRQVTQAPYAHAHKHKTYIFPLGDLPLDFVSAFRSRLNAIDTPTSTPTPMTAPTMMPIVFTEIVDEAATVAACTTTTADGDADGSGTDDPTAPLPVNTATSTEVDTTSYDTDGPNTVGVNATDVMLAPLSRITSRSLAPK